ncbi:MAG: isoleucine--tRNA ligase, partial [Alphaproteobacteria bacterium]
MSVDYKATVFLPRTDFPMRAGLPAREPEILRRWQEMDLYGRLRKAAAGREKFVLHDGPPYANGHLHMGHALNKILKDVINRSQQMLGKDANYVPGWDCHGLPIEWKVEEQYRARGQDKDKVPAVEFRRQCREFAQHWIGVQTEEFQRLGVIGDWRTPYTTMAYSAEAQIVREVGKFLLNGGLYRGAKPVLWSVVERTALADAEVEYHDHTSTTIWVRFPVVTPSQPALAGAAVVIWTTTPWTIPGNRAVAFKADAPYVVIEVRKVAEGARARPGERLVVARPLLDSVLKDIGVAAHEVVAELPGAALAGTVCAHPLRGRGYDFDVPLHAGDFVTMDQGTGFVHIAPGHGSDDYELGLRHGLEMPLTVDGDGRFMDHVPLFAGRIVYTAEGRPGDANPAVVAALDEAGALLAQGRLRHAYPHSWRSKAPLIFRNTPQWFISMEANDLRKKALAALMQTRFIPEAGRTRLYAMIESRPDWCISRQRLWGVPLPIFVHKASGEPLRDGAVIERIARTFEQEGGDAWFTSDPAR